MASDAPGHPAPGGGGEDGAIPAAALHDLGPQLQPALLDACGGRLREIKWFRTDWQIGGAATAYGVYDDDRAGPREVVIKLPVGPREYRFLTALSSTEAPTPRVARHGLSLAGYDIAWVVMERLPGDPLSARLHKEVFEHLAASAAAFYRHCGRAFRLEAPPAREPWEALLNRARDGVRNNNGIPSAQSWAASIKHTHKALPHLETVWRARRINAWCHGDLHPGNCMRRDEGSPWGPPAYVLFDLAEVHPGHWVEDAVYLERLFWGRPQVLDGVKPVSLLARARRAAGLDTSDDYATIANVRRILMAATAPAFLGHEGHPPYLNAALETLDRLLATMKL